MDRYLVVFCHQFDLGEDGTTEKLVGVVMDMTDGVALGMIRTLCSGRRDANGFFLGHDVNGG
jgi:hypothetical protein